MKVLISHPGKQHSYRTAQAVLKQGHELDYCTTVYDKPGSLTNMLKLFLNRKNRVSAESRKSPFIPDECVKQVMEMEGLYQLLLERISTNKKTLARINDLIISSFAKKVAKIAKKRGSDIVISYDYNSSELFSLLDKKKTNSIKVLDCSAANRLFMSHVYIDDLLLSPDFADKLQTECPYLNDQAMMYRLKKEIASADFFLAGSTFVKKSLEFSGVSSSKIFVCPYGVDLDEFSNKEYMESLDSRRVRFVFVGGTKQIKGLSYMLQAFQMIDHRHATFTIIGKDDLSNDLKKKYGTDVNFLGIINHRDMPRILRNYDVMVFPSLGEGFGLSILEAMATGIPVISSTNTGINDYIRDGYNGFIVPIQNANAIADKMRWFIDNRKEIPKMGYNATITAKQFTWDSYYEKVGSAITSIFDSSAE